MRTEDPGLWNVLHQSAQRKQVATGLPVVRRNNAAKQTQPRRTHHARPSLPRRVDVGTVKESVPGVEPPAVSVPDRHAAVSGRMTVKGNQKQVLTPGNRLNPLEVVPDLSSVLVLDPGRDVKPLRGHVARSLPPVVASRCVRQFRAVNVHARLWKIGNSPGVVDIEVREDDVTHVAHVVTQSLNLADRRLLQHGIGRHEQAISHRQARAAVCQVSSPQPRVDEHEAVRTLYEKTRAHQTGSLEEASVSLHKSTPRRAKGGTIEEFH